MSSGGNPLDIGMAIIGVAVAAADGSAGGIAAAASAAGVDGKGGYRGRAGAYSAPVSNHPLATRMITSLSPWSGGLVGHVCVWAGKVALIAAQASAVIVTPIMGPQVSAVYLHMSVGYPTPAVVIIVTQSRGGSEGYDDSAHLELCGGFCAFSTIAFLALASVSRLRSDLAQDEAAPSA
jgi:hypothetical protein